MRPYSIRGRVGAISSPCRPAVSSKKDTPAKLAKRIKRRWRVVLLRAKGEILGDVEAPDGAAAKVAAVARFDLWDGSSAHADHTCRSTGLKATSGNYSGTVVFRSSHCFVPLAQ